MTGQTQEKDSSGHIRNPLTVISRFAAIAEISGTAVLPFISPENQTLYIWFLMLFPALLVGLFFLTLNFNHKTLYAPSDYKNQNHFLNLFGIATADEREHKLEAELEEEAEPTSTDGNREPALTPIPEAVYAPSETKNPQPSADLGSTTLTPVGTSENQELSLQTETDAPIDTSNTTPSSNAPFEPHKTLSLKKIKEEKYLKFKETLEIVENEAIAKLRKATKIKFDRNIKIETNEASSSIMFDGVAILEKSVHAAEVKYFEHDGFNPQRFLQPLKDAWKADQIIKSTLNIEFIFHVVVVIDGSITRARFEGIAKMINQLSRGFGIKSNVYAIEADKLLDEALDFTFFHKQHPKG